MDLPYPHSLNEAKKKLQETYCFVNGELVFISIVEDSGLIVHNGEVSKDIPAEKIKSLSVFLPETGIYTVKNVECLVTKLPKRQWKKSFSWDFYKVNKIVNKTSFPITLGTYGSTCKDLWKTKDGVFYLDNLIGLIKDNKITLISDLYRQEIIDLGRKDKTWLLA